MNRCYKCETTKELSIKARHRDGSVRSMICKACRRASRTQPVTTTTQIKWDLEERDAWAERAKESHDRILRRFAI